MDTRIFSPKKPGSLSDGVFLCDTIACLSGDGRSFLNPGDCPFVVMLSVPLAAVGVCVGFSWTGASFVEGAFIGTVLLIGIAVNDSILLTDRFRQLQEARPHGRPSHPGPTGGS